MDTDTEVLLERELQMLDSEDRRLAELSHYAVTIDNSDPNLNFLTQLAVKTADAQIGGISIVYQSQIWLPSRVGVDVNCVPRAGSFCAQAVSANADWFEVEDATLDPRFCNNPLVTQAPGYRHYAAALLQGTRGYLLGTLWVMNGAPGLLNDEQRMTLQALARQIVDILELRYYNEITGLSNRATFLHHLQLRLAAGADTSEGGTHVVVGFVDLMGFRQFNEVYGRNAGNQVLRIMGERLGHWAGPHNLVAHLGGDRFSFALFGQRIQHAEQLEQLKNIISAPFKLENRGNRTLHARVGIERVDTPFAGAAVALLDAADTAASSIPGKYLRTTIKEYRLELLARSHLLMELQGALDGDGMHGSLVVHYQPQVNFRSGRLLGLEALVRWQHPAKGLILPQDFIALAESANAIYPLDHLVLLQVCRDMRHWMDAGLDIVPVSLNMSRASLLHPSMVADLRSALEKYRIPGHMLELEITESQLLETPSLLPERIEEFRALGVGIAVDDFGTGYSNLDAINSFPFDRLKVDRQFVHGVAGNERMAGLFHLIQGIAELFEADLLCEGLEDAADLQWLAQRGANCVQGWYFSKSRTPESIVKLLTSLRDRPQGGLVLNAEQLRDLLKE
ncbi:putative bifunctional diguanylate cyclase/phosphodiesterase [Undibacterium sp.]|jgi:diguanylate cyclase (GGDEF)-like protein|uniref:putative bifunctional diguanylate cyclase/phosphodiesterase n=1 Tax=Undibacterium sp. TaxID=1914977 RepID=UPI002BC762A3|nr:EAL domain-containing protein [Undibacterium sp.]HTD05201.1 EAL domain-containing protein [Undibacterium sp.]